MGEIPNPFMPIKTDNPKKELLEKNRFHVLSEKDEEEERERGQEDKVGDFIGMKPLTSTLIALERKKNECALRIRVMTLRIRVMTLRIRVMILRIRVMILRIRVMILRIRVMTLRNRILTLRIRVMTLGIRVMTLRIRSQLNSIKVSEL
ncbi:hypothetical protein CHS0354_007673 [Potamilus streckersoni]|uniref:Uncharacterized protein n=1 Tax=Potamilus streckersoni TaxID=2493646 RepID=A0AAE0SI04_9BIVA|nr:hypothetical protein CHS0354_007673 [Potamilus streckersoni]